MSRRKLHVLMRKEDLDAVRLAGKVVVVIDVLFATSTVVTAFEHGARDVLPASGPEAAREVAAALPSSEVVLAGEHDMRQIDGFASYAPLALSREPLAGRHVVYSTTNGTVALWGARGAERVYAGSLLNGAAVAERILGGSGRTVLLVCAGSGGAFNLEDFFGAGYIVDRLLAGAPGGWSVSDAGLAARATYLAHADDPAACLGTAWLGKLLRRVGSGDELEYVARPGALDVVPVMQCERLVRADGNNDNTRG